jgi:hypothetical protein
MRHIIYDLTILIFFFSIFKSPVLALDKMIESSAFVKRSLIIEDKRPDILKNYLLRYNSNLSDYSELIIERADVYQIPWSLLPAISGVESTFCRHIPINSFNCWGWENGKTYFKNYEEAIEIVSRTLGKRYYARGLNNPFKIGPIYAPPSSSWGWKVNQFMEKIENYPILSDSIIL